MFDQLKQFHILKKLVMECEIMNIFRGLPEVACPAFVFDLLGVDGMPQAKKTSQYRFRGSAFW